MKSNISQVGSARCNRLPHTHPHTIRHGPATETTVALVHGHTLSLRICSTHCLCRSQKPFPQSDIRIRRAK
jgi:hypothetical protein